MPTTPPAKKSSTAGSNNHIFDRRFFTLLDVEGRMPVFANGSSTELWVATDVIKSTFHSITLSIIFTRKI
ncbi:MAG: hypothetical protein ACJAY2_002864 [Pseudomonadales bacterium]|jgi:hypothetical protein